MIVLTQSLLAQSSREYLNQLPDYFNIKAECNKCPSGSFCSKKKVRACDYIENLLKQNDPAKNQPVGLILDLFKATATILDDYPDDTKGEEWIVLNAYYRKEKNIQLNA